MTAHALRSHGRPRRPHLRMLLLVIVLTLALLAIASSVHSVASASSRAPADVTAQLRERLRSVLPKATMDRAAPRGGESEGETIDDPGRGRHAPPDTIPPRVENEWIPRTIPARWGHQLLYDASRNRVVVIGGAHQGAIWGDAWAIDLDAPIHAERVTGAAWDHRFGPGISAVIEPGRDQLFVYGGRREGPKDGPPGWWVGDQGGPFSASLAGSGVWRWLDPYGSASVARPSARHGHVAVLDEARHQIVMFGGRTFHEYYGVLDVSSPQHDVWQWSLDEPQHWEALAVSGASPTETIGEGAAWDPVTGAMWYVARGGVWKLDLAAARWDSIPAAGANLDSDATIAFDPVGRRLYRYSPVFGVQALNVDTPVAWTTLRAGGEEGLTFGPIAWDSRARRLLRFSGAREEPTFASGAPAAGPVLWALPVDAPERGWQVLYDARTPPLTVVAGVFDARRDRVIAIDRLRPLAGIYELRGGQTQWSALPVSPEFVMGLGSLVLDEIHDRLVLDVSGTDNGMPASTFSYDLGAQDGWQFLTTTNTNNWISGSDLAWDADQQRVIRFAWTGEQQTVVQALVGTPGAEGWRSVPVVGESPRIRIAANVASDPERGRVFVLGGILPDQQDIENLWVLEAGDTARWTKRPHHAYLDPFLREWPVMAYDPVRKLLLLQGVNSSCCGWRYDGIGIGDQGAYTYGALPGSVAEWWAPFRYGGGLVYDGAHHAFVAFGGMTSEAGDTLSGAYEISFAKPKRTIRVDARPGAGNDGVRPGTHQTLQVAALSDAGFDARTLDLATVRVAGVPIRRDGGGRPLFTIRDVDGNGREDIVLGFDAHDLAITETNELVTLWGRTFDDVNVEGLATVAVKTRRAERNAAQPGTQTVAPMFAVRTDGPASSLRFTCTVAGLPGARIEAFDIAGRRVASGMAPSHTGSSVVDLVPEVPLARGIYVVRLTGPATLSRKVVALP